MIIMRTFFPISNIKTRTKTSIDLLYEENFQRENVRKREAKSMTERVTESVTEKYQKKIIRKKCNLRYTHGIVGYAEGKS